MNETNASDDPYIPPDRLVPPKRPVPPSSAVMAERRREARDPATTPERLRELAAEVDAFPGQRPRFAAALAANPRVPTDLVSRYLYLAPGDFCRNPALAQWTLKSEFFSQSPKSFYQVWSAVPWNARRPLPAQQAMCLGLGRLLRSPRAPRSLVVEIAAQRTYSYLASAAQSHVHIAHELAPEEVEASLAEYWTDALARKINKTREKLLRQLFDRDLAPDAIRLLLPASLKAERDAFEETQGWNYLRALERDWVALKESIATGISTKSFGRIEEVTRENLIRKALDCEEPGLLQEVSATVLLYRTLALLRAPEELRRARIRGFAESSLWQDRVAAALALRPFPGEDQLRPKHRTLLHRLSLDGNRYVRAVARRRIAQPDWQFPYF